MINRYPTRKYVILTAEEVADVDFDTVLEDNPTMASRNVDGTRYVVKYEGSKPQCLHGKEAFTYPEIKEELEKPEWTTE